GEVQEGLYGPLEAGRRRRVGQLLRLPEQGVQVPEAALEFVHVDRARHHGPFSEAAGCHTVYPWTPNMGTCRTSRSLPLPRYMWTPQGRHGAQLRTARMISMPLNFSGPFSSKIRVFFAVLS